MGSVSIFGINDYVFYGVTGVCRIADFRMVKLGGMEGQECYVLEPISAPASSIYISTSNDEILAYICPIMSKGQHSKSKRLGTIDSKIMGTAERLLYEEFAFVLGLDAKDVFPFIQARVPRQAI